MGFALSDGFPGNVSGVNRTSRALVVKVRVVVETHQVEAVRIA
jgi:hypothetical protein